MCKGLSETEARASHAVFVGRGRAPILQRSWEGCGTRSTRPPFSGPWGPSPAGGFGPRQGPCTKPNEGRPNPKLRLRSPAAEALAKATSSAKQAPAVQKTDRQYRQRKGNWGKRRGNSASVPEEERGSDERGSCSSDVSRRWLSPEGPEGSSRRERP